MSAASEMKEALAGTTYEKEKKGKTVLSHQKE